MSFPGTYGEFHAFGNIMTQLGKVFSAVILVISVSCGKGPNEVSKESHKALAEAEDSGDIIHSAAAVFSLPGGRCHDGDGFWCTIETSTKEGQARVDAVQDGANKESFLDWMLGTNCHSKALAALNKQCRDLDPVEKSRLALMMMECQLVVQGQGVGAQSQRIRCLAAEALQDCVSRLHDREHAFYVEFLTHIDAMCLFIQNKNFEKYAEYMLNMLVTGADKAVDKMEKMKKDLKSMVRDDFMALKKMSKASLSMLQEHLLAQQEIIKSIIRQQQEVESYHQSTTDIISMHVESLQSISESHVRLEALFRDAHGFVADLLETLQSQAREIVIEQQNIHTKLVHGSQMLVKTLDKVERYHMKTNAAISAIFGNSYTLEDALFYVGCFLILACMHALGFSRSCKLYILMWIAANLVVERLMLSPGAALHWETSLGSASEEKWFNNSIWKMILPSFLRIPSSYLQSKGFTRRFIGILTCILWTSRALRSRKSKQGQQDDGQPNTGTMVQTRQHVPSCLPYIKTLINPRAGIYLTREAYSEDINQYRNIGCFGDHVSHPEYPEVTSLHWRLRSTKQNPTSVSEKSIQEELASQRLLLRQKGRPKSDELCNAKNSSNDTLACRKQTQGAIQMGRMLTRGRKKALESQS